MGVLGAISKFFGGSGNAPAQEVERSDYDAASDARHIKGSYTNASDRTADRILEEERPVMRRRIDSECRNNAYLKHNINLHSIFAIGTGSNLQGHSENKQWVRECERLFKKWSSHADIRSRRRRGQSLAKMMALGDRRLWNDGDFHFVMERADWVDKHDISLRLRPVRSARRKTPLEFITDPKFDDGIQLDDNGEPEFYWFLKKDPGDTRDLASIGYSTDDFVKVPAEAVIHAFVHDDFEQNTGAPQAATAMATVAADRRFRSATLDSAETAAKFSVVYTVTHPELINYTAEDDSCFEMMGPEASTPLRQGMQLFAPPGYDPKQIDPKHPSTTYVDFKRENLQEMSRTTGIPVNLVTGDSSQHNFASAQFDGHSMEAMIGSFRKFVMEEMVLEPVFEAWLREAVLCGLLEPVPEDFTYSFGWPVNRYWRNPLHQASADEKNLQSRKCTLYDLWDREGMDSDEQEEKLIKQDELVGKLKNKPSWAKDKTPQQPPAAEKQEETDKSKKDKDHADNAV